ncbi:alpha/beta fold hydrolase [Pelagibius sp. Alg239-R121]|uniref:alpha/beta fold hydrolase n=1 Tax=Pelagibius sp. Alg239-R121 TaxID=2993448 RepID=UPI0024A76344|nr:alpha/beta fold hydrolase [Pelagibius sp. Alg239-R121]
MITSTRRQVLGSIASATTITLASLAKAQAAAPTNNLTARNPAPAVAAGETFSGTWPFKARYSEVADFPMHYIDEGAGSDTLLLLHGEPTWSYLFRNQIPLWAQKARVIAVDHMGFGKSATPNHRTYWLQDHIDNLERFVLAKDLRDLTLVMHDFGGPVGMGLAIRHPWRIKRIVSVNGPTPLGQPDLIDRLTANTATSPWFQWISKANADGTLETVLGQLDYNILSTLKLNGFERNEIITDSWLTAYRAPFPTPRHAAGAIGWAKGFATGAHKFEIPDTAVAAELSKKPALALWGDADRTLQADQFLPLFRQAFPGGEVRHLSGVGHYSPEDAPVVVGRLVSRFLRTS